MKKIYLLLITIMLLSCFGCSTSSANSSDNPTADAKDTNNDTTVIYAEQLTYVAQRGDADGEKTVGLSYDDFGAFSYPDLHNKKPLLPDDKRQEVVEKANIPEYGQDIKDTYFDDNKNIHYSMGSVLTIIPTSPTTGLSKGDKVTYEIAIINTPCQYKVNNGYEVDWDSDITLEEVEEILGVKFEPSEYIVK